ncbi:MAG: hypothetical protein ACOH1N_11625 [Lutibacter sp.]
MRHSSTVSSFDFRSKDLVGSLYINDKFLPAKTSDSNEIYLIRYNAYMDEMEGEKNNKPFHLIKTMGSTISFEGINKIYSVYNYEVKDKLTPGFFVVLTSGDNISLLLKEKVKFYEEVKAKTGYDKYIPPTLKRVSDEFYIGYKDNSAKELPSKKKELLNIFESKAGEIESYAKENKLGFKTEDDLIQIFKYYNTLN